MVGICIQHHYRDTSLADFEAWTVKCETVVKYSKKHKICNALRGTEDAVVFQESGSSYSNSSVDNSDSNCEDFTGFCDHVKLHTALPCC
jgi:hypothetical protein